MVKHIPAERNITVSETRAHEFKAGQTTVFTMVSGLVVGKTKANGTIVPFAADALKVALWIIATVNTQEVEMIVEAGKRRLSA